MLADLRAEFVLPDGRVNGLAVLLATFGSAVWTVVAGGALWGARAWGWL